MHDLRYCGNAWQVECKRWAQFDDPHIHFDKSLRRQRMEVECRMGMQDETRRPDTSRASTTLTTAKHVVYVAMEKTFESKERYIVMEYNCGDATGIMSVSSEPIVATQRVGDAELAIVDEISKINAEMKELKRRKRHLISNREALRIERAADERERILLGDHEEPLPMLGDGWRPPWEPRYSFDEESRLDKLYDVHTAEAEVERRAILDAYDARMRAQENAWIRSKNSDIAHRNAKRVHALEVVQEASRRRHPPTIHTIPYP